MQKLYISPSRNTPEISFSPEENIYFISGTSAPEDVRALYYPVIEWLESFASEMLQSNDTRFTPASPFRLRIDLKYFNSSSAKFLHDIFSELKNLLDSGINVVIEWCYEDDDPELKEAGSDLAAICGIKLIYVEKKG